MNPNQTPDQNPGRNIGRNIDQNTDQNDVQIDRVLHALRDTTPLTGMDRRILNILEAHSSQKGVSTSKASSGSVIPSEAKRSRGIPAFRDARTTTFLRWTTTAALAALIIAAALTMTSHRRTRQPTPTAAHNPLLPSQTTTATTQPPSHQTTAPSHTKPTPPQFTETEQPAEDAQLSHPAPPIPITAQERILMHYASRGRTEDLAQISNEHNAAKEQQDAEDFQAFFTPPPLPNMTGESE